MYTPPKPQAKTTTTTSNPVAAKATNFPVPYAGNQPARLSLMVDVGTQEREDFVDPKTQEAKPQKPAQQVVLFADLVDQVVDYGGEIGEAHYRLMLNKKFMQDITGVNFNTVPPRDGDGNLVEGKGWTFHPANMFTKLAKAMGKTEVITPEAPDNTNIVKLLNGEFYIDVDVTQTPAKNGKTDEAGNPIIYTNVKSKGVSPMPLKKGKPEEADPLLLPAMIINHNNVVFEDGSMVELTADYAKYIRGDVLSMMKKAPEYQGSKLQQIMGVEQPEPASQQSSTVGNTNGAGSSQNVTEAPVSSFDDFDDMMPF